MKYKCTNKD